MSWLPLQLTAVLWHWEVGFQKTDCQIVCPMRKIVSISRELLRSCWIKQPAIDANPACCCRIMALQFLGIARGGPFTVDGSRGTLPLPPRRHRSWYAEAHLVARGCILLALDPMIPVLSTGLLGMRAYED
jgi:hypothetical protein